jgi:sugar lactone lactonase YvrE
VAGPLRNLVMRAEAVLYPLLPPRAALSGWKPASVEPFTTDAGAKCSPADGTCRGGQGETPIGVLRTKCVLGEGPLWDPDRKELLWLDINRQRLHAFRPAHGVMRRHRLPALPGAAVRCTDGALLLATHHGIGHYDPETCCFNLVPGTAPDWPRSRFNDGKCDRAGRFWTGTMRLSGDASREKLYRFEAGRDLVCVDGGFTVCNGLGWSPDDRTFYLVDTAAGRIYAYDFDLLSGAVANRRIFAEVPAEAGRPDGLSVDAQGGVWVANSGGWQLMRYDDGGRLERTVRLPVPRPTSCVFGGPGLDTLYVTSSRLGLSRRELADAPLSGSLFALDPGVVGLPEPRFANRGL